MSICICICIFIFICICIWIWNKFSSQWGNKLVGLISSASHRINCLDLQAIQEFQLCFNCCPTLHLSRSLSPSLCAACVGFKWLKVHIDVKLMDDELAITCGYIFLSCISHKAINPLNCCKLADGGSIKYSYTCLNLQQRWDIYIMITVTYLQRDERELISCIYRECNCLNGNLRYIKVTSFSCGSSQDSHYNLLPHLFLYSSSLSWFLFFCFLFPFTTTL